MTFIASQPLARGFPARATDRLVRCGWWLVVCFALAGCQLINKEEEASLGRSPLRPAQPSPESVTLELYWVRFAYGDPAFNEEAWQEIDEGKLPASLRRELANNGFRAGIVGNTLPDALATALQLDSAQQDEADVGETQADYLVDLMSEPTVRRRILQLQRDRRAEVQASDVYPALPLLVRSASELGGRTFHDAQAMYALRVDPRPEGRVDLELTPEIHYGPSRMRYDVGDGGVLRHTQRRDAEVYTNLRVNIPLAAGEMLVLMNLPESKTNLGHYFHTTEDASGRQQKLILIRLANVPPSDTFAYVP